MLKLVLINCAVVVTVVLIHYEFLRWMDRLLPSFEVRHRQRIVFGVFGALVAHAIEVWIFAVTYWWMVNRGGMGALTGAFDGSLLDCTYYSFTTYTTLGFGDISPVGDVRYLTGVESLTGLVLITWSASFFFVQMSGGWQSRDRGNRR